MLPDNLFLTDIKWPRSKFYAKPQSRDCGLLLLKLVPVGQQINQNSYVRWGHSVSSAFSISNGVRQAVLSHYLFTRYIRDMISVVVSSNVSCIIDGQIINLLAHANIDRGSTESGGQLSVDPHFLPRCM